MTPRVSARALWHPDEKAPWQQPLFSCTVDGWDYISDRFILIPVARLLALPLGYGNLLVPLAPQAEAAFADWLNATVIPAQSDRLFAHNIIGPLEDAGFVLRPLVGVRNAHGICDPDLKLVGLAIPLHAAVTDSAAGRKRWA